MICPKCEEGTIKKVLLKKDEQVGFLCDFCGTIWLAHENIGATTGHLIHQFAGENDVEYTLTDRDEKQESQSVMYPEFK